MPAIAETRLDELDIIPARRDREPDDPRANFVGGPKQMPVKIRIRPR